MDRSECFSRLHAAGWPNNLLELPESMDDMTLIALVCFVETWPRQLRGACSMKTEKFCRHLVTLLETPRRR